jgi:threonylcarbamoyladenosine tRNA methylthiotransferase MtaB
VASARRYRVVTLGCKLNQFDTAALEGLLRRRGLRAGGEGEPAELVVVNTCTVTGRADAEARRLTRRLHRQHPRARLLVTGCYAERDARALASLPGVDAVVGHGDRDSLPGLLDRWLGPAPGEPAAAPDHGCETPASPPALHFGHRTRAYLKVQEGCDLRCSYCVIPRVRGASRSVAPGEVARSLAALVEQGYREVVLTGVNTGDWGKDLPGSPALPDLLERLLRVPGLGRLRLNSLEPRTVSDSLLELLADPAGRLAPHLQVPLQSGSDTVLRAMRRNYRTRHYRRVVERLRERVPDVAVGADVIVGFPGEGQAEFEETRAFIDEAGLDYLHVFSWSAREGTPAASLPARVDPAEVRRRAGLLRELAARRSLLFRRRFLGRTLEAVTLDALREDGRRRALTGNFIDVTLPAGSCPPNRLLPVRILSAEAGETAAEPAARA